MDRDDQGFPRHRVAHQKKKKHFGTQAAKKAKLERKTFLVQTEELKCQVKTDKGTKAELPDIFRAQLNTCNEAGCDPGATKASRRRHEAVF